MCDNPIGDGTVIVNLEFDNRVESWELDTDEARSLCTLLSKWLEGR